MKKALFYEKKDGENLKCTLCPNDCVIKEGNIGFCGVRKNIDGTLYSLIHNLVSSMAIDPVEKKPLYHFYPGSKVFSVGTIGCNMRCLHCQNWQIAHTNISESNRYLEKLTAQELVEIAIKKKCKSIAFTYNEPTIWFEYTLEGSKLAKEKGLSTIYVTSGWIHKEPLDMIAPYLDAYSLDIKGFTDEFYKKIANKPSFKPVLDTALNVKKRGIHLEIVTNIIPGYNDDYDQINKLCGWIAKELGKDTPLHLTAFHPAHKLDNLSSTPLSTLEGLYKVAKDEGLKYVYLGNIHSEKGSTTFCPECNAELINRSGFSVHHKAIEHNKCTNCGYELTSLVD